MLTAEEIIKTNADVLEIRSVLVRYEKGGTLDREKVEQIIQKHNCSDACVALMNSPLNSGGVPFEQVTDQMIAHHLASIQILLEEKLLGKSINELQSK